MISGISVPFNKDKALLKFHKSSVHEKKWSTLCLLYLITSKLQAFEVHSVYIIYKSAKLYIIKDIFIYGLRIMVLGRKR